MDAHGGAADIEQSDRPTHDEASLSALRPRHHSLPRGPGHGIADLNGSRKVGCREGRFKTLGGLI
jgi:hypothetical protein